MLMTRGQTDTEVDISALGFGWRGCPNPGLVLVQREAGALMRLTRCQMGV